MRIFLLIIFSIISSFFYESFSQEKEHINLEQRIRLYPNPISSGVLNLDIAEENTGKLAIYDFLGIEVYTIDLDIPAAHKYRLYLSDFSSGKYFVKINIEDEVITKKILIL